MIKGVSGAQHGRDLLFTQCPVHRSTCPKRAEAPLARHDQSSAAAFAFVAACLLAQRFGNAGRAQRLIDPPRAIAAPQQALPLGARECGIVDIPDFHESPDKRCDVRTSLALPAALTQLALEIIGKLARTGCEPCDIGQRHLLHAGCIERFWHGSFTALCRVIRGFACHPPHSCHSQR